VPKSTDALLLLCTAFVVPHVLYVSLLLRPSIIVGCVASDAFGLGKNVPKVLVTKKDGHRKRMGIGSIVPKSTFAELHRMFSMSLSSLFVTDADITKPIARSFVSSTFLY